MKDRERRPEKMSQALRRDTERKWPEDRYVGSAGDGGVWLDDDDRDDDR